MPASKKLLAGPDFLNKTAYQSESLQKLLPENRFTLNEADYRNCASVALWKEVFDRILQQQKDREA